MKRGFKSSKFNLSNTEKLEISGYIYFNQVAPATDKPLITFSHNMANQAKKYKLIEQFAAKYTQLFSNNSTCCLHYLLVDVFGDGRNDTSLTGDFTSNNAYLSFPYSSFVGFDTAQADQINRMIFLDPRGKVSKFFNLGNLWVSAFEYNNDNINNFLIATNSDLAKSISNGHCYNFHITGWFSFKNSKL